MDEHEPKLAFDHTREEIQTAAEMLWRVDYTDGATYEEIAERFPCPPEERENTREGVKDVLEKMTEAGAVVLKDDRYFVTSLGCAILLRAVPRGEQYAMHQVMYWLRSQDGATWEAIAERFCRDDRRERFREISKFMVDDGLLAEKDGRLFAGPKGMELLRKESPFELPDLEPTTIKRAGVVDVYEDESVLLMKRTKATAIVLFVFEGNRGSSLSVVARDPSVQVDVGSLLMSIANEILTKQNPWVGQEDVKV